jgi:hypothetical protein
MRRGVRASILCIAAPTRKIQILKLKLKRWRGLQAIYACNTAPMLDLHIILPVTCP